MGRSKARRWVDDNSEAERSPVSFQTSYLDVVRLGSQASGSRGSATAEQSECGELQPPNVTSGCSRQCF